jgi:hypothetical protein
LSLALAVLPAAAQDKPLPDGGLRFAAGGADWVAGIDANLCHFAMRGTWRGLASLAAPDFDTDRGCAELWLMPRLDARRELGGGQRLRGVLSLGITQDLGSNAFDERNQGTARLEQAWLGWEGDMNDGRRAGLSAGSRDFMLGTGMLVTLVPSAAPSGPTRRS